MQDRIQDLETIKQVFDKFGVRFFLVYGALLGMYRDGNFIEHDDDIDLAVIDPISFNIRKQIGWMLSDLGFKVQPIMVNVEGRMEELQDGYNGTAETGIIVCERNFKFTIFFFQEEQCEIHGPEYVCIPKYGAMKLISTPKKFYEKPDIIKINKKKYLAPTIKPYLEFSYKNWRDKNGRDHSPLYNETHESLRSS